MIKSPPPANSPVKKFTFSDDNLLRINAHIAKYPEGRQASALLPTLDLAQRQNGGWINQEAMEEVARLLSLPFIRVHEVATFYTMFNLSPVGKHHIQICGTTPCWLRGAEELKEVCQRKLGIEMGDVTADGQFSLVEVECLGACVNGPMVQINDDYIEDLTPESLEKILDALANGEKLGVSIKTGSQINRQCAAPVGYDPMSPMGIKTAPKMMKGQESDAE
jgi:NADH-quinone oxidoreductase subunit E